MAAWTRTIIIIMTFETFSLHKKLTINIVLFGKQLLNDVIWPNSSVETGENLKFLRHIMYWFPQDCSSVHFCRELRRYLDDWSADKYISRTTRFYQYDQSSCHSYLMNFYFYLYFQYQKISVECLGRPIDSISKQKISQVSRDQDLIPLGYQTETSIYKKLLSNAVK